jgi:hypothetical protein
MILGEVGFTLLLIVGLTLSLSSCSTKDKIDDPVEVTMEMYQAVGRDK